VGRPAEVIRRKLRATTEARNACLLACHVLPRFGTLPLSAIDHLSIREWVADLTRPKTEGDAGLAPESVEKVFNVLDKTLQAAVDARMLAGNPADRVPLPTNERDEQRFLTPTEVARLAEAMPERYRSLVSLAACTGLRIGELAGLRRRRLDTLRRRIEVAEVVTEPRGRVQFGPPKTRAGHRIVPVPRSVVDQLVEHVMRLSGDGPDGLFPGRDGGVLRPAAWRQRVWHPAVERAGLAPLVPHELRHTAVSWWIADGADPKRIAVWAGHSSVRTILDLYGHLYDSDDEAFMTRLDARLVAVERPAEARVLELPR
jgi:integrase